MTACTEGMRAFGVWLVCSTALVHPNICCVFPVHLASILEERIRCIRRTGACTQLSGHSLQRSLPPLHKAGGDTSVSSSSEAGIGERSPQGRELVANLEPGWHCQPKPFKAMKAQKPQSLAFATAR